MQMERFVCAPAVSSWCIVSSGNSVWPDFSDWLPGFFSCESFKVPLLKCQVRVSPQFHLISIRISESAFFKVHESLSFQGPLLLSNKIWSGLAREYHDTRERESESSSSIVNGEAITQATHVWSRPSWNWPFRKPTGSSVGNCFRQGSRRNAICKRMIVIASFEMARRCAANWAKLLKKLGSRQWQSWQTTTGRIFSAELLISELAVDTKGKCASNRCAHYGGIMILLLLWNSI